MFNFNIFKRLFKQEEDEEQIAETEQEEVIETIKEEPSPSEFTSAEIIFEDSETEPKIKQLKKQRTYRNKSKYR